jgi:hypothetical protein
VAKEFIRLRITRMRGVDLDRFDFDYDLTWMGFDPGDREEKAPGLAPRRLALRQGDFVSEPARQAGIRQGDVIIGVDGKALEMTAQQFAGHVRLTYQVGDPITYNILRDGKRVDMSLRLRGRGP